MESSELNQIQRLEERLNKYTLWSNMIPRGTWNDNLRKVLPKAEWDRIRKVVYKRQSYACAICGSQKVLHCHEDWQYNYEKGIQKLKRLVGLCELCHMNQHLGFCQVELIPKGKLSWEELAQHWGKVNGKKVTEFYDHKELAFKLWQLRSKRTWTVVDNNERRIDENYYRINNF